MTFDLSWLWYALGAVLGFTGLWLADCALLRDRSRGRRRCPKCWYSMQGVPGLICPECGTDAGTEKRLLRTRRQPKRAALACLVLLAAYVSLRAPVMQRDGWAVLVPSTALVLGADPSGPPASRVPVLSGLPIAGQFFRVVPTTVAEKLSDEAWRRATTGRMWRWQTQILVGRFIRAQGVKPASFIRAPARWIANEPMPILLSQAGRASLGWSGLVEILDCEGEWSGADLIEITPGSPAAAHLRLSHSGLPLYETTVPLDTQFAASAAEFLVPVSGPQADATVLRTLSPRIARGEDGTLRVLLNDRGRGAQWDAIDFGIGCAVEARLDGKPVGAGAAFITWDYPVWKNWIDVPMTWTGPMPAPEDALRVELIVRADPAAAMNAYRRFPFNKQPTAWSGELRVNPREYSPLEAE